MAEFELINITEYDNSDTFIEAVYAIFQLRFRNSDRRITFKNKQIFIDYTELYQDKSITFWHIASFEGNDNYDKYTQYPCENTFNKGTCEHKCKIVDGNCFYIKNTPRIACLYRASYINFVYDIIKLSNDGNSNIQIINTERTVRKKKTKRLVLRYKDKNYDYAIIFEPKYNESKSDILRYKLITAYPIFSKDDIEELDRMWKDQQFKKESRR